MGNRVIISRTCEGSFEAVSQLLKTDATQAIRSSAPGAASGATRMEVHLSPKWPRGSQDEIVTPTVGHYEAVGAGKGRLNLSWRPSHHKLPDIDGHLEIDRLSTEACEIRYDGQYEQGGLLSRLRQAGRGSSVDDAVGQLLDTTVANIRQHLTTPL